MQGINFIWTQRYSEIFKSALVYLKLNFLVKLIWGDSFQNMHKDQITSNLES